MIDRNMGKRCIYSDQCHIYQGKAELKQPLFLVKNIFCNNGYRWWSKCEVFKQFEAEEPVLESMVPDEGLRPE